jgi:hypothetical protein
LALELYGRHRTLPRSLVLTSAYAGWTGSLPAEVVSERVRQTLRAADLPVEQFVNAMLPSMFSESPPVGPAEEFRRIMLEIHLASFRVMARAPKRIFATFCRRSPCRHCFFTATATSAHPCASLRNSTPRSAARGSVTRLGPE